MSILISWVLLSIFAASAWALFRSKAPQQPDPWRKFRGIDRVSGMPLAPLPISSAEIVLALKRKHEHTSRR